MISRKKLLKLSQFIITILIVTHSYLEAYKEMDAYKKKLAELSAKKQRADKKCA